MRMSWIQKKNASFKFYTIGMCTFIFLFLGFVISSASGQADIASENIIRKPVSPNIETGCDSTGRCVSVVYSGPPAFAIDKNGNWKSTTDVLSFSLTPDNKIVFTRDNGDYAIGEVFMHLPAGEISLKDLPSSVPSLTGNIRAVDKKSAWKFSIDFPFIPPEADYVSIKWNRSSKDIVINYDDLRLSNFTVIERENEVVIKDFANSIGSPSSLDPIAFIGNESAIPRTLNHTWLDQGSPNDANPDLIRLRNTGEMVLFWINFTNVINETGDVVINATFYMTTPSTYQGASHISVRNVSSNEHVRLYADEELTAQPGLVAYTFNNNPCGWSGTSSLNNTCTSTNESSTLVDAPNAIYSWDITNMTRSVKGHTNFLLWYWSDYIGTGSLGSNQWPLKTDPDASKRPRVYFEYISASVFETSFIWNSNLRTVYLNDSHKNKPVNITYLNVSNQGNFTVVNATDISISRVIYEGGLSLVSKYLQLSGGTLTGTLVTQLIQPSSANTYDIGLLGTRFRSLYVQTTNSTNATFESANVTKGITSDRFYGKLDCSNIDGGSDSDFCTDANVARPKSMVAGRTTASLTADGFFHPVGAQASSGVYDEELGMRIPFASTITNLTVFGDANQGSGDKCWTVIRKGTSCDAGTTFSDTIVCQINDVSNECQNTTAQVTVNGNDCIYMFFDEVAATCSMAIQWSFVLEPT